MTLHSALDTINDAMISALSDVDIQVELTIGEVDLALADTSRRGHTVTIDATDALDAMRRLSAVVEEFACEWILEDALAEPRKPAEPLSTIERAIAANTEILSPDYLPDAEWVNPTLRNEGDAS